METLRDYQFVEPDHRGASAAIGNFDGVHLGHQSVIDLARKVAPDAIIATGRSDFPNQVNNVLCIPFLFRAALDTRSLQINRAMKMAYA